MPDHEMFAEPDGSITHIFAEGAEPSDLVRVDHIVTGFTVGRMSVSGDWALLLEFDLKGESETGVVAVDLVTARGLADAIGTALERI